MVLTILGYYGKNFGDLLMLQGILNNEYPKAHTVNIVSYDTLNLNSIIVPKEKEIKVYKASALLIKERIGIYRSTDVIMWGGGSCFNDVDGTGAVKQMLLAKLVNPSVKVVYYGVGIDIKHNKFHKLCLNLALKLSSRFKVRDFFSYEKVCGNKNVSLIDDPIYLNKDYFSTIKKIDSIKRLTISYRNVDSYFPENKKEYLESFINAVRTFISNNKYELVTVFSCDYEYDMNDNQKIYESLKDVCKVEFIDTYVVYPICQLIANSSMIITGRLHVAVVADMFGVPFYLLNYSAKNAAFCDKIRKQKNLIEYKNLYSPTCFGRESSISE